MGVLYVYMVCMCKIIIILFLFAHMPLYITVVMHECILVWKSLVH